MVTSTSRPEKRLEVLFWRLLSASLLSLWSYRGSVVDRRQRSCPHDALVRVCTRLGQGDDRRARQLPAGMDRKKYRWLG
jgi:hypothetical protein